MTDTRVGARELKDMAAETDPRRDPARCAGRVMRRVIDKARGK